MRRVDLLRGRAVNYASGYHLATNQPGWQAAAVVFLVILFAVIVVPVLLGRHTALDDVQRRLVVGLSLGAAVLVVAILMYKPYTPD